MTEPIHQSPELPYTYTKADVLARLFDPGWQGTCAVCLGQMTSADFEANEGIAAVIGGQIAVTHTRHFRDPANWRASMERFAGEVASICRWLDRSHAQRPDHRHPPDRDVYARPDAVNG